jgi:hypothetical protein
MFLWTRLPIVVSVQHSKLSSATSLTIPHQSLKGSCGSRLRRSVSIFCLVLKTLSIQKALLELLQAIHLPGKTFE